MAAAMVFKLKRKAYILHMYIIPQAVPPVQIGSWLVHLNSPITTFSSHSYHTHSNHLLSPYAHTSNAYYYSFSDALYTWNSLSYSVISLPS